MTEAKGLPASGGAVGDQGSQRQNPKSEFGFNMMLEKNRTQYFIIDTMKEQMTKENSIWCYSYIPEALLLPPDFFVSLFKIPLNQGKKVMSPFRLFIKKVI